MMNILVLIKQVPDTEASIQISDGKVKEDGIQWIMSPYDEIALEEAIRIKEKNEAKVTVVSVGLERSVSVLRTAYAMGADDAILVKNENYEMLDSYTIAASISGLIQNEKFDIILAGRQATDSDNGQVPLLIATTLGYPIATYANKIELEGEKAKLTCETESGEIILEANLPVVVTANDRLNEPRYPSLKGIMASKKKPILTKDISDLVKLKEAAIEVIGYELPQESHSGRVIEGESAEEKVISLVDALHNEIKII